MITLYNSEVQEMNHHYGTAEVATIVTLIMCK